MRDLNYIFKIPNFDSKIKFYFSLMFMSINDYTTLIDKYGEDINILDVDKNNDIDIKTGLKLNNIFDNLKWNNEKIDLNDKTIMRLFTKEEVVNYYDAYSINNNFDDNNPVQLEKFYIYMLLEKVKEKKELEYGNIYELFDTFSDEEILNAVANLDFEDKKTFIDLFGLKGDITFEINSNDHIKNDILIKLYRYMLLKRDEADIPSIIRNIKEQNAYKYTFYDYIRSLCGDKDLTNGFIFEMLSKMDYNSKQCIKDVFGEKLDKKRKPPKDKQFKKVVDTLTVIVKINKDYRKRKETEYNKKNKKKAGFEKQEKKEEKKDPNKEEKKEEKNKEETKKEPKKEQKKPEEKPKEENKKNKKEEPVKKENKKSRLKSFLEENNLEKKDFEKAVELLAPLSKRVVELYYGIKTEPIELEEISEKMGKPLEDILSILSDAEDKIVDLIKTGEINKRKEEVKPVKEKEKNKKEEKTSSKLKEIVNSNKVKAEILSAAMLSLEPIEKIIVDAVLYSKDNPLKEVSLSLNIKEEEARNIYETASSKIISLIDANKEEKQESEIKEPKKEEKSKEEKKEEKKKQTKDKTSSLDEFLRENGLTKSEFFNAFSKLDGFSKNVLSMYLGIYSAPCFVSEIATKYGRSIKEIENIISSAKDKIVKESKSIDKINLNNFLNKNGMSMDGFKEGLKNISPLNRNLLKDYFGIGVQALSLEIVSKKYGKNPKEINSMVMNALNEIVEKKTIKKDNGLSDKLNKFLSVNNITKEQFINALELISPEEKMLVSMYFGLNGKEMSIPEIAIVTKTNPVVVKNNLKGSLRQINTLAKSNDLSKNMLNQRYQNVKFKIARISSALIQDASFMAFVSSNPMISGLLSIIGNMNLSLDDASKILGISNDMLMNELMSLDMMCDNFVNSVSNKVNNGFQDEESVKNREVGRKY